MGTWPGFVGKPGIFSSLVTAAFLFKFLGVAIPQLYACEILTGCGPTHALTTALLRITIRRPVRIANNMSARDIRHLERLTDVVKYNSWAWDMEVAMKYQGLWNVVLGTEQDAERMDRGLQYIRLYLGSQFKSAAQSATTAGALWDAIREQCQGSTDLHLHDLREQFADIQYLSTDTPQSYIERIRELLRQLNDAGDAKTETDAVKTAVRRLPPAYASLRSAINMMGTNNMTLAVLLAKLRYEESMLKLTAQADPIGLVMQYLPAHEGENLKAFMVHAKRVRDNDADRSNTKIGKFDASGSGQRQEGWESQGRDAFSQRTFPERGGQGRDARSMGNTPGMGQGGSQNGRGETGRDTRRCYNCLQFGHIQRFCKNPRALFAAPEPPSEDPAVSEQL
jgi:gag-polypeptide of LTR copia-type